MVGRKLSEQHFVYQTTPSAHISDGLPVRNTIKQEKSCIKSSESQFYLMQSPDNLYHIKVYLIR
jgi:hypothetical protein